MPKMNAASACSRDLKRYRLTTHLFETFQTLLSDLPQPSAFAVGMAVMSIMQRSAGINMHLGVELLQARMGVLDVVIAT